MSKKIQQEKIEKIQSRLNDLKIGQSFKNYTAICEFFGIEKTGGNTKKSTLEIFKRIFDYEKADSHEFVITLIHESIKPKIINRFLRSEIYPMATLNIINYIDDIKAGNKINDINEEFIFITKNELSSAIGLTKKDDPDCFFCNDKLTRLFREEIYFVNQEIKNQKYDLSESIIKSINDNAILSINKVIAVKYKRKKIRKATESEIENIREQEDYFIKKYSFKNRGTMFFSSRIDAITGEISGKLGFKYYTMYMLPTNHDLYQVKSLLEDNVKNSNVKNNEVCYFFYKKTKRSIIKKMLIIKKNQPTEKIIEPIDIDLYIDDLVENGIQLIENKDRYKLVFCATNKVIKKIVKQICMSVILGEKY